MTGDIGTANTGGQPAGSGQARTDIVAFVPPSWLVVVMAMSAYGIWESLPLTWSYDLPDSVVYFVYAGMAVNGLTILWGLWVLALALGRSALFPRHFIAWQGAQIAWAALREAYVLVTPEFVFSARSTAFTITEIAVGVACIAILRAQRRGDVATTPAGAPHVRTGPPPVIVSVLLGLLGLVLGGAVGFGAGLGLGVVIADATEMSCFEGACGFFAFFLGVGGLLIGAIAGAVFAVWRANRTRPATTS